MGKRWSLGPLTASHCLVASHLLGCALPSIHRERDAAQHDPQLTPDAGPEYDPKWDPKNRNEDFEAFSALLPTDHLFAEWPMTDVAKGAVAKPSYSATDKVVTDNVTKLRWRPPWP